MRVLAPCALLACFALLPGCFLERGTINEPLDRQQLAQLTPGRTTAREVVELLGAPTEVVQLGKRSAYRYDGTIAKTAGFWLLVLVLVNKDTRSDRIWVFFDERDLLTHAGGTFAFDDASYAMPWQSLHEKTKPVEPSKQP
jgi:outer membrane protein assembly factor BamE (lipoprotein component of BamABCDE complex)